MASAKLKGKQWYDIIAPELFDSKNIGETPAKDEEDLIGRTVEVGIQDVTDRNNKYYLKAILQIDSVDGAKAKTKFVELVTLRDYISRMIQRRVRRIDSIVKVRTKDGVLLRVKTIGVSIRRINTSLKASVRKVMDDTIRDYVRKNNLNDVIMGAISDKPQVAARSAATKQYPLRGVEIRKIEVLEYPEDKNQEE